MLQHLTLLNERWVIWAVLISEQSVFWGIYKAPDTTSETLYHCTKDILLQLNLLFENYKVTISIVPVMCCFSGVQARLKEICPGLFFAHCCNHALNLVLQEVVRDMLFVVDVLIFVQSIATIIRESAKHKNLYQSVLVMKISRVTFLGCVQQGGVWGQKQDQEHAMPVAHIWRHYVHSSKISGVHSEIQAKIAGHHKIAMKGRELSLGFSVCEAVFTLKEESCGWQNRGMCISKLKLPPDSSRINRMLSRFCSTTRAEDVVSENSESLVCDVNFIKHLIYWDQKIQLRFDQDGMTEFKYSWTERLYTCNWGCWNSPNKKHFKFICLYMFIEDFKEVEKLLQLCLCLLMTAASSERCFSSLCRLKLGSVILPLRRH